MKAIVVMYDSLNRHLLSSYGCDWTLTPNVSRLAERAVTFDTHYVGSMPCMPARREMHSVTRAAERRLASDAQFEAATQAAQTKEGQDAAAKVAEEAAAAAKKANALKEEEMRLADIPVWLIPLH